MAQKISDKELLAEGKRIKKLLGRKSFTGKEYQQAGGKHLVLIEKRFGWSNFRKKIGGEQPAVKTILSDEALFFEGKRIMTLLSKFTFTREEYRTAGGKYCSAIEKRFGWSNFLKEIGVVEIREMNLSDKALFAEGKRIMKLLGKSSFTQKEYKAAGGKYHSAIMNRLRWNNFLKKIGAEVKHESGLSDEILFAEGKRIMTLLAKQSFMGKEYQAAGGKYYAAIIRRFGWNDFLRKIRGNTARESSIPNKMLITEGKRILKLLGKSSFTRREYQETGGKYYGTISRRMGWQNFMKKIGGEAFTLRNLSDEALFAEGKRIMKLLGKSSFTRKEYIKAGGKYHAAIFQRFGWSDFMKKIGGEPFAEKKLSKDALLVEGRRIMILLSKLSFTMEEYRKAGGKYSGAIEKRFGWNNFLLAIGGFPKIASVPNLLTVCKDHKAINTLVWLCKGNEADIATILSVVNSGWNKSGLLKLLRKPSLRSWMGQFTKVDITPTAIAEASFELQSFMKNDLVRKILLDRLNDWRRKELGPRPTTAKKRQVENTLRKYASQLSSAA